MDMACTAITTVGTLVTAYSIYVTIKYNGLKKQITATSGAVRQSGGGQQQVGVGGQQQRVDKTTGNVTTINNYGTLHYNTETTGAKDGGTN